MLEQIEYGALKIVHGDAQWRVKGAMPGPLAELRVHRPAKLMPHVFLSGGIGFAKSYMSGDWESPNLAELLLLLEQSEEALLARMWKYYLAYCEAGFRLGRINLAHVLLERD